jgi:hypothetical protein
VLAPTPDDLAAAYARPGPAAPHELAAGLAGAGDLLVVLGTGERSRLVGVDAGGSPQWTVPVPVAGRALAGDLVLGEVPTGAMTVRAAVGRLGADRAVRVREYAGLGELAGFTAGCVLPRGGYALGAAAGGARLVLLDAALEPGAVVPLPGDTVTAVAAVAGGVLVATGTEPTLGPGECRLLLVDDTGAVRADRPADGWIAALAPTGSGAVAAGHRDAALAVLGLSAAGEPRWQRLIADGTDRRGLAVAVGAGDRVAVAGQRRHDPDHRDLTVTLLGPDGTPTWDRDAGSGGADTAAGVVLTAAGVAVACSARAPGGTTRVRLLALAPDGTPRWDRDL